MADKIVAGIITAIMVAMLILFVTITFIVIKYRRLSTTYYERLSLLQNRDPGRNSVIDSSGTIPSPNEQQPPR